MGRGVGSLSNLEKQLSSSLTVRKNYLKQKYPDDQTLSELYKVENDQLKKIESWTTTYTASEDCIVSFYTDGYENSVNSSTYGTLNPSDVRAVIRGAMPEQSTVSRGSDPIFRTVIEDEWYALFLCQDRDWNPVVGETYQMQLTGFDDYVIPAQVVSFTRIGSDLLLRMHVSQSVEPVLNIRTCGASVGDFVTGYSVPISALYTMDNMIGRCGRRRRRTNVCRRDGHLLSRCRYGFCSSDAGRSPLTDGQNDSALLTRGTYHGSGPLRKGCGYPPPA